MNKKRDHDSQERLILVLNGGSTSLKFALFSNTLDRVAHGSVSGLGTTAGNFKAAAKSGPEISESINSPHLQQAIERVAHWLAAFLKDKNVHAVGHRFVHGGLKHARHCSLTRDILNDLKKAVPFDPEHMPDQIKVASFFYRHFSLAQHTACFDTAFHHDLPIRAQMLPLPVRYFDRGIRKFGFHGISCAYLLNELANLAGADAARGRVIVAHLGGGSSITAIHNGRSQDTSMSFSSTSGIPMATRSGDLDPMLAWYFFKTERMSPAKFSEMVTKESGLCGLSGGFSDMRQLLKRRATDARARTAVEIFCYQARKCIASMAAGMGGVETLIFSGGIAENNACIREEICEGLGFLGLRISARPNRQSAAVISDPSSKVAVRVIPTDEEREIARIVLNETGRRKQGKAYGKNTLG